MSFVDKMIARDNLYQELLEIVRSNSKPIEEVPRNLEERLEGDEQTKHND